MTVLELITESKNKSFTEKEVLLNLQKECGLKLSEALEVCKNEFTNSDKFIEAAHNLKVESLPNSGYIRKDGVTVITDDWEE